ncbi:MAG TPA: hypothetical protein VHM91_04600 [Verrucomicrobiales bacterium]|nr:hypothetical protein [Verrucomicrobiales bacterium]
MKLSNRSKAILTGSALPLLVTALLFWQKERPAVVSTGPAPAPVFIPAPLIQRPALSAAGAALLETAKPANHFAWYSGDGSERAAVSILNGLAPEELRAGCDRCRSAVAAEESAATARLRALLVRWASLSPAEAFSWTLEAAAAHQPPDDNWSLWEPMLKDCGTTWAAKNPKELAAWWQHTGSRLTAATVMAGQRDTLGQNISVSIAEWLAGADEMEAVRYFVATPDIHHDDQSGRIMNFGHAHIGGHLRTTEEAGAALDLLIASKSTHEGWREPALEVISAWIHTDAAGFEKRLPQLPDEVLRKQGSELLGLHRMETTADPAAAADAWLANPGGLSERRIQELIVETWSLKELNAAGEWLNHRPRTPERWDAVEKFSNRAVSVDPVSAFAWLGTIENATERYRRTARIFDQWERTDPVQAGAFAQNSGWDATQMQWIEERRAVR